MNIFKEKNRLSNIKYTFHFLKLSFRCTPGLVVFNLIHTVLYNYLTWAIYTLLFTYRLFKLFESEAPFEKIVWLVGIFAIYFLISSIFSTWFTIYYRPIKIEELNYKFLDMLFRKVSSVDISCYENTDFYDTYIAALKETETRAINILDSVCNLIGALVSAMFFMGAIAVLDFIFMVFIIAPIVISYIFKFIGVHIKYKFQQEKIPFERKMDYIQRSVLLKKYAKDVRTSNLLLLFKKKYNEGLNGIVSIIDKYKHKLFIYNIISTIADAPISIYIGWLYAAYKIMVVGTLQMSDYIVISTAVVDIRVRLTTFSEKINELIEHGLYVQNFIKMMQYKPKIDQNQKGLMPSTPAKITFKNVGFTYCGQTNPVLKNINFEIELNSTIALLGHNGAGKSTLVKLIMRLYDVTEGEILLDGINIKEYNLKEYQKLISTVFQQPELFALSIKDNIAMGNLDSNIAGDEIDRRISVALSNSGLVEKINGLSEGINSVVTKEFVDKGVEFSGGEYQKLAIARAMFKDSPIIILDEPSSALDPFAEYEMYEKINNLYTGKKNKIVVLISHRMSCALLADKIILLEQGEILESGTHDELMIKNGKYREMFQKQKYSYKNEEVNG